MTTITNISSFFTSQNSGSPDFVSSDTAALASHMDECAKSRGGFFGLHAALEFAHALLAPRMMTVVIITLVLLVTTGVV